MDFKKSQIPSEQLPDAYQIDYLNTLAEQIQSNESLTKSDLYEKLELLLVERTKSTDEQNRKINPKKITENRFILAQFYFDSRRFKKAHDIFDAIKASYYPAMFQLGIILYDDLLDRDQSEDDQKSTSPTNSQVDIEAAFRHPNREKWSRGFEYMLQIANLPLDEVNKKLIHQAQFNVGKAYFLGFGCKQSDQKAEEFWLKSADNGSEYGNVTAMTYLAFFYSRKSEPEFFDLDKSYFWHNEACGNGSLESQGALGAMYYYGIGRKKDYEAAYECLTNSSERGNVFSMGLLCDYYYRNKFYVKATELAKKVSELNDIDKISRETNCLRDFISKGIGLACFTLARCYEMAKGIEKDTNKAQYLYKRTMIEQHNKLEYDEAGEDLLEKGGKKPPMERMQWDSFMEYFLSIIGFVIDLGNVWRFPTICYQNGGGAFLIPFLICLFVIGMPCMYLELAAGQYFQLGNISIWTKISPHMKGIGFAVVIINILMLSYYNTLQAYALYYFFNSFRSPLPWSDCSNEWNTDNCHLRSNVSNLTDRSIPSNEYFVRKMLGSHKSTGIDDLKSIKPDMLLALVAIFLMTTGCLIGGIKTSGKAVYVTALLPYVCLAVLIVQCLSLDGSIDGLRYYITPEFDKIFELKVWLAASVQVFFSLGPGFGVLITYSSYTKKNTNIKNLTIMCSLVNCITSLLYGVVVFAGLGYMAKRFSVDINYFLRDGIGLVYVVYPEIISTFKLASLFAVIFFIMLITLGLDSAFGGMEGLYTAIADEFPMCRKYPLTSRLLISSVPFLTSLPTVTYGGIYVVQWMDTFAISPSVLLIVCTEVVTISWFYGLKKFCNNIKEMNGSKPFINWRLSWKYLCPALLFLIVLFDILFFPGLAYGSYVYPKWAISLGYTLNALALSPIPGYAIFYFIKKNKFSQ